MDNQQNPKPFHILALSGGGYRGLYTATILRRLEQSFGQPLARHFDLICGTSAGGLLALGLAAEIPAEDLETMFLRDGKRIFDSRGLLRRIIGKWVIARHSPAGLRDVLTEKLGTKTIGDLQHRVLIPAVNYSKGGGQFFKTPHLPKYETDHQRSLVDVGLATAAAPTYFPLHRIDGVGVFADGGLVANSPGFVGLHEARRLLRVDDNVPVRVLSIGTMTRGATVRGSARLDRGIFLWGARIFDLVISAQEIAVHDMLTHVLGSNYFRIDDNATPDQSRDIEKLDVVTAGATHVLRERGAHAAQRALGDPALEAFRNHLATPPMFYHGANKNAGAVSC